MPLLAFSFFIANKKFYKTLKVQFYAGLAIYSINLCIFAMSSALLSIIFGGRIN